MDFGLAKERRADAELQKLTATGIILGTPEFMSPEQLRGKPLDPRTDVYSLALMTYEMLTGEAARSAARTQQEMMIARLRSEPVPLRQAAPDARAGGGGARAREGDAARPRRSLSDGAGVRDGARGRGEGRTPTRGAGSGDSSAAERGRRDDMMRCTCTGLVAWRGLSG